MLIVDLTVMNVALPHIERELGFSPTGLAWVINAYTLPFGGFLLLGGRAGDWFGQRRVFLLGVVAFTLSSLLGGLADSAEMLIAARALQGVGAAAAGPNTLALVAGVFVEPRSKARALGLSAVVASGGFGLGLVMGGLLTEWFSWRAVLFINVPIGVLIAVSVRRFVGESLRRPNRLDVAGALTAVGGAGAVVYGFIRVAEQGWGVVDGIGCIVAGLLLMVVFVFVEARIRMPLMPLWLFGERNRAGAFLNFFLGPMITISTFFFLTQFMQTVLDYSALMTGLAFLPMACSIFVMARLMPMLLERWGPKPLVLVGAVLLVAGLLWLIGLSSGDTYFTGLFGPLVLVGLGGGVGFSPLVVVIMTTVGQEDAGVAGGVLQTMQQLGAAVGLALLVTIATMMGGARGGLGHAAFIKGMSSAFVAAAVLAAMTFAVGLTFRGRAG
ncbi:drug resistance transporter, EmrB/QacA subfamily [Prauserella marina]|uniref:Drug resistance transporter, EmrB/QacA subfamily n=2 Tax=Prauserella marina TaxID=530584 RepID=A0A1G6SIV2_9PSEU|nr:EmrB/QacA subfamily drug resistance transporter [Prauserella marina]SDD16723.1 drug resistance transporter, EmrB/QacA subfamily [Prauserella marina]